MLQPESVKKNKHSDLFELCYWSQLSPELQRSSVYLSVICLFLLNKFYWDLQALGQWNLGVSSLTRHHKYLWVLAVCVSSGNTELLDM